MVQGVVQSVRPYGAFIELDVAQGLVGLLHISQISKERVSNIETVFSVGDRVKVRGSDFSCAPHAGDACKVMGALFSVAVPAPP